MTKCPHCGKVPYPAKNQDGTWNWKNVFRIDWGAVVFVLLILFMVWAYNHDTEQCKDIVENPYKYCDAYCETKTLNSVVDTNQQYTFNLPKDDAGKDYNLS